MYLVLDGQLSGRGLYRVDGFPLDEEDIPLSQETWAWIDRWLEAYWKAKYNGFKAYRKLLKKGDLIDLDKEGLRLKAVIQEELQRDFPDVFLTYWSEAVGEYLNDGGKPIQDWHKMVSN